MTMSSRASLFSPGTTLRGSSPGMMMGQMGTTNNDWNQRSFEPNIKTPQHYGPHDGGVKQAAL